MNEFHAAAARKKTKVVCFQDSSRRLLVRRAGDLIGAISNWLRWLIATEISSIQPRLAGTVACPL